MQCLYHASICSWVTLAKRARASWHMPISPRLCRMPCLTYAKTSSHGFNSGLYAGRNNIPTPYALNNDRTMPLESAALWILALSSTRKSPATSAPSCNSHVIVLVKSHWLLVSCLGGGTQHGTFGSSEVSCNTQTINQETLTLPGNPILSREP